MINRAGFFAFHLLAYVRKCIRIESRDVTRKPAAYAGRSQLDADH